MTVGGQVPGCKHAGKQRFPSRVQFAAGEGVEPGERIGKLLIENEIFIRTKAMPGLRSGWE